MPSTTVLAMRFAVAVLVLLPLPVLADEPVGFNADVRPILSDSCFTCHGPDARSRATEMRLDTREGTFDEIDGTRAVVPGDLAKSELWRRITSDDPDVRMPPPDSGRQLTKDQISTLRKWIEQDAPWEGHWAFIPPKRPATPDVSDPAWARNEIDPFVLAKLDERELAPNAEAPKETLIRRVTLDLTGLPPTLAEVDAFLADDRPDAYERLVDRLLASPRYGEFQSLTWLDAARYSDSNGYQQDRTRTAWPWRDWLVRALNENQPFDRFSVEMLAGDLLPEPSLDQRLASGFHRNHMLNGEGGRIAEESRVEYVVDRVETTSTVWLGLTLGCARCHDHKYDPFSQREFYELYAFFNNIDESGRVDAGGNANPVMSYPLPSQREEIARLERTIAALQRELDEPPPPIDEEEFAKWEAGQRKLLDTKADPNAWQLVKPLSFTSREGQTMTLGDDLAILTSGENPAKDVYTVTVKPTPGRITGLRLEALPHPSMTVGGLARSDSGNFVLTRFEAVLRSGGASTPLEFASAVADHEQGGLLIANALKDGDAGWAVLSNDMKQPRTGVFRLAKPIDVPDGAELVVTLRQESRHAAHNLGRFRLAVTANETPDLDGETTGPKLPEKLAKLLAIDPDERQFDDWVALQEFYNADSPRKRLLERRIADARGRIANVEKSFPSVMVMRERGARRKTNVLIRGAYDKYGDEVERSLPAVLRGDSPSDASTPPTRLDLANWVVDPEHPLTARVTVNRYWQHFFGHGLVRTPEDFGVQGERPTHPALLDWLATEFVRTGWNVKRMHRLIVTSATYRQSSAATLERLEADPENRLLTRGSRHRLPSMALRDQALALSGLLVERVGGQPVQPYQPARIWEDFSFNKIKYVQDHGDALYRRSLYTFWRRSVGPTTLFDTSSRQVCTVNVRRTNTPLHALTTQNDKTYVEAARKLAERIVREGGDDDTARTTWAFRLATSRRPTDGELAILLRGLERGRTFYGEHPEHAASLLSVGESPRDESLDPVELAAWSGVAGIVLNQDEVLVRE